LDILRRKLIQFKRLLAATYGIHQQKNLKFLEPTPAFVPPSLLCRWKQNTFAMIRRTFFELLSGAFLPRPPWNSTHVNDASPPDTPTRIPLTSATIDPEWLKEWMRLPRQPLFLEDLSMVPDLNERGLLALIMVSIGLGEPFQFYYFGGSEPGKSRRVLPVMVFTTALEGVSCGVGTLNPIYLLAWCQVRRAPRTFRVDRVRGEINTAMAPADTH
jgi:hypothetical protein